MPRFRYKAIAPDGRTVEDVIEADDREGALARLRADQRLPVALDEDHGPTAGRTNTAAATKEPTVIGPLLVLIEAGLGVDQALNVLVRAGDARTVPVARALLERVRSGQSLSQAMAASSFAFSPFAIAIVRAGEAGGALGVALRQLMGYLDRAERLRRAIRTALIYPTVLVSAAVLSLLLLLIYVVPQFESLFRESAAPLPAVTRAVIAISAGVREQGWLLVVLILLGVIAAKQRREGLRRWWQGRLVAWPVSAAIVRRLEAERFARSLAALLRAGIAVQDALAMAIGTIGNDAVAEALHGAPARLRRGETLAQALAASNALPALAIEFVRIGEAAGNLAPSLERLADTYAVETEDALRRLVLLVEPVLIIAVGLVVGIVVLSLLSALVGFNALAV
ncbi:MAG: type II secretion system F family protein [Alphaproteobacteria bacterium]|nr:type II secretion system F family protein [Alphaproteobacteria bacterium]